ncbi:MAG: DUF1611 domain-containing protein [Bacteroidota bacterium]
MPAVLQHNPARKQYKDMEHYKNSFIPDPKDEIALIKIYGAPTVALTVNTAKMVQKDARDYAAKFQKETGNPRDTSARRWSGPISADLQSHDRKRSRQELRIGATQNLEPSTQN